MDHYSFWRFLRLLTLMGSHFNMTILKVRGISDSLNFSQTTQYLILATALSRSAKWWFSIIQGLGLSIMGNYVYVFQSPRVPPLFRDLDCLLYNGKSCLCNSGTRTVYFVVKDKKIFSTHFSHPECLHYSVTQTVYFVVQVWNLRILSTHFIHLECLHYSGTQSGYNIMRNYVYIILWHGLSILFRH